MFVAANGLALASAAYEFSRDEQAWLDGVAAAARSFDVGGGVAAYTVHLRGVPRLVARSTPRDAREHAALDALAGITASFSSDVAQTVYAPTEFAGNAGWRLARLSGAIRGPARAPFEAARRRVPAMWSLIASDGSEHALALCFLSPDSALAPGARYPHGSFRQLGLAGAHLGAALRLRRALGRAPEAVLDPAGRMLHAEGVARSQCRSLTEAVLRSPLAERRIASDDETLAMWRALVQGRWSLIDFVDRDGKRYVLARRNDLESAGAHGLEPLERDVARLAALGHSYKYIGYELGISRSRVVRVLERALRRLGVADRRELARRFGASLQGAPAALNK